MSSRSSPLKRDHDNENTPSKRTKPFAGANIASFFKPAPKSTSNSTNGTPPAIIKRTPFDKVAWAEANLSPEDRPLLKLEIETLDESWFSELKDVLKTQEFLNLKKFLENESKAGTKVFPPEADIYTWSRHTPLHKVKVVIFGQDPYHNDNQAHGLSFSVRPPTRAPASLGNMYKALKIDYPDFTPPPNRAGDLTQWADQGVLLLNACLTVRAHQANSHAGKGWELLTQRVVDTVARKRKGQKGVVFLAWGAAAQKRCDNMNIMIKKEEGAAGVNRNLVLKSVHPSPLSAARGFYTCGHFKASNEWLASRYGPHNVINWSLTPGGPKCGPPTDDEQAVEQEKEGKGKEQQKAVVLETPSKEAESKETDQEKDGKTPEGALDEIELPQPRSKVNSSGNQDDNTPAKELEEDEFGHFLADSDDDELIALASEA